jgi:hypothetical protein
MRFNKLREPYRGTLIGLIGLVPLILSKIWPEVSSTAWIICLSFIAALLFYDLKKPVNFDYCRVSENYIEYGAYGQHCVISANDISKMVFLRQQEHLPSFDEKAARNGINSVKEGTWICYS